MTVVPCLADQPHRTGEPPARAEGAVLVREPQPNRESAGKAAPPHGPESLARPAEEMQDSGANEQEKPLPPGDAADADASAANASATAGGAAGPGAAPEPALAAGDSVKPKPLGGTAAEPARSGDAAASNQTIANPPANSTTDPARADEAAASTLAIPSPPASSTADPARSGDTMASNQPIPPAPTTPQPPQPNHPDPGHPARVRVVVDWDPFSRPPRRVATREEMVASAHRVLARRQPGRHRKPDTREPWMARAADFVVAWAATLRMALLLLAGTAFLSGLVLMNSPIAGAAATLVAGVAAWAARPRKSPTHRC